MSQRAMQLLVIVSVCSAPRPAYCSSGFSATYISSIQDIQDLQVQKEGV